VVVVVVKMLMILLLMVDLVVVPGVVVEPVAVVVPLNHQQTHYMVPLTMEMREERHLPLPRIMALVAVVPVVQEAMLIMEHLIQQEMVVLVEHLQLHMVQEIL
tara:strand:+ start:152 stop:460 length:309 start_codon:yes stop_codon:yes gene_type:complete